MKAFIVFKDCDFQGRWRWFTDDSRSGRRERATWRIHAGRFEELFQRSSGGERNEAGDQSA